MRRAFTLLELIIVVGIIGLIAGVGSVFVREYGEQRNAGLTRQKVEAIERGLLAVEKDEPVWYASGFVSDMGSFPPELTALLNQNSSNVTLIHADENNVTRSGLLTKRLLMPDNNSTGGVLLPAPFLNDEGHDENLTKTVKIGIYGGYAGPYAEASLKDGWNRAMEFNGSIAFPYSDGAIVSVVSAGADRRFTYEAASPIKEEFDESADTETEKAAYAGDISEPLPQRAFRPESLEFDLSLEGNSSIYEKAAVIVYTPMLYYIEDTNCSFDADGSTGDRYRKAECNGGIKEWKTFSPDQALPSFPATYAVGVAKYHFTLGKSDMNLSINNTGIPSFDESAFMRSSRVAFETGIPWSIVPDDDDNTSFYLFGGQKSVVVLKEKKTTPPTWEVEENFPWVFKPGRNEVIRNAR